MVLPWDDRDYDEAMRLSDIGSLMPYHSHVASETVVGALNRMIDDVSDGKRVFYDFSARTGLFFYRRKKSAPFAVICPGGGFEYVASVHEGFPYAMEINAEGYNAFVLRYRAGHGGAVPRQDLIDAMRYIFRHAETLGVDTADYSLWGSSAGARMAAAVGSGGDFPQPATVVMAYTAHSEYSSDEPATFVVVGEDDRIAPTSAMERRVRALRALGTDVEYRKFGNLGHGFGPGIGTSAEGWIRDAIGFWQKHMQAR